MVIRFGFDYTNPCVLLPIKKYHRNKNLKVELLSHFIPSINIYPLPSGVILSTGTRSNCNEDAIEATSWHLFLSKIILECLILHNGLGLRKSASLSIFNLADNYLGIFKRKFCNQSIAAACYLSSRLSVARTESGQPCFRIDENTLETSNCSLIFPCNEDGVVRWGVMGMRGPKRPGSHSDSLKPSPFSPSKMGKEVDGEGGGEALLTPPLALEGGLAVEHRVPNIVQRILSLFRNVRPGSELTRLQLPPLFNIPKSHLQTYGESVYCYGEDLLGKCARGKNPLDRFANVVAWSISTTRPLIFGAAPFNPVLGETHHVSNGNLNVRLEQVSHHPPVSALHATDEQEEVELVWSQSTAAKYYGTSVEAVIHGKRVLKLLNFREAYEMNSPKVLIRFFPLPGTYWVGNVRIRCRDSGLEADLCYDGKGFLGFGGNHRSVRGKIFDSSSSKTIYEINGFWDSTVTLKNAQSGETTTLYNAKDIIRKLNTPSLRDPKGLEPTESAVLWREVGQRILKREWEKAREAKRSVEEKQRQAERERKARGESWVPKYFAVSHSEETGWDCIPLEPRVPPAPIVVSQ
ncbi:hypothetical protein H6P81_009216 [Aristolochia fimbriata]|uniref:Oxysterol-binding protein n=1 Tax=Aristolochia fimbriata TaxID=158543 RepID=A0AAV7ENF1_ARIFI|nr:hypothetical protein H6P81_009216 [Aristolochia fimbriata]